ncbi:MAG: hypothetical protein IJR67_05120 [Acholeplasmatales bacterium]|nr:hypothetical protein [Acholeplasmatales bacterium]
MSSYMISGTINAYPIKTKSFKNYGSALRYLDKLVFDSNIQIENIINNDKNLTTYVANNYSRVILTKLV